VKSLRSTRTSQLPDGPGRAAAHSAIDVIARPSAGGVGNSTAPAGRPDHGHAVEYAALTSAAGGRCDGAQDDVAGLVAVHRDSLADTGVRHEDDTRPLIVRALHCSSTLFWFESSPCRPRRGCAAASRLAPCGVELCDDWCDSLVDRRHRRPGQRPSCSHRRVRRTAYRIARGGVVLPDDLGCNTVRRAQKRRGQPCPPSPSSSAADDD